MRKLSVLCCLIIVAILVAALTVEGDVSFQVSNTNNEGYAKFLIDFRGGLGSNTKVFNITLLRRATSPGPAENRYTKLHLTSPYGQKISVVIDVTNVYVLGFLTLRTNIYYFFNDSPAVQASTIVFRNATTKIQLPFSSSYPGLERLAGSRQNIGLGLRPLGDAIKALYNHNHTRGDGNKANAEAAKASLVLIQTTSEAARFRFIERDIANATGQTSIRPTLEMKSLQNNWGHLSEQVQIADKKPSPNRGKFDVNVSINGVLVGDVYSTYVRDNLALLLNTQKAKAFGDTTLISHIGHPNYATI